ncbi:MAG: tyrosine-type recombinase/integrase [Candidatus Dormibacteraeota bacterium]|nr:tyrosine-type recombinase/integrase [Candidatus Dormibacteraeota bacterium]
MPNASSTSPPQAPAIPAALQTRVRTFLEACEIDRNLSPLTIRQYDLYLDHLLAYLSQRHPRVQDLTDLDPDAVRAYKLALARHLNARTGRPLARVTQTYFLIALRSLLRYWAMQGLEVLAPDRVELGKAQSRSLKFLDPEQMQRLLCAPDVTDELGLRDRAVLELFFSTGLRVSELASLNRDDVNLRTREFGVIGKGRKTRIVFLTEAAATWVERYVQARTDHWKPLFIRTRGERDPSPDGLRMRMSPRSIERIVEKYVKAAGLAVDATPHTLRHSFATDLLSNGADLRAVQEMLGHANLNTTQIYTHVTNPQLRAVHRKFHSGNRA